MGRLHIHAYTLIRFHVSFELTTRHSDRRHDDIHAPIRDKQLIIAGSKILPPGTVGILGDFFARRDGARRCLGDIHMCISVTRALYLQSDCAPRTTFGDGRRGFVRSRANIKRISVLCAQSFPTGSLIAVRLPVIPSEYHSSCFDCVVAGLQSGEFLRHIGGGGLAVDRWSPVGRCDFVVDLVDIAKARFDTYANHAIISAHHTPLCRFDFQLSGTYGLLLLSSLSYIAPIECFIVHSVRSRAYFIDLFVRAHDGFFA